MRVFSRGVYRRQPTLAFQVTADLTAVYDVQVSTTQADLVASYNVYTVSSHADLVASYNVYTSTHADLVAAYDVEIILVIPFRIRVEAAFGSKPIDEVYTWTTIHDSAVKPRRVKGFTYQRGRQNELGQMEAGSSTVDLGDASSLFDPSNPDSPYYGNVKPMLPVRAYVIIDETLYPMFLHYAERLPRTRRVTSVWTERQVSAVDGFGWLAQANLVTTAAEAISDGASLSKAIRYNAREYGPGGRAIRVSHSTHGDRGLLDIGIVGNDVTIYLATDHGGHAVSTAAQVVAFVNSDETANKVITASLLPGSSGSGIPSFFSLQGLGGGTFDAEDTGTRIQHVLDAVDWPASFRTGTIDAGGSTLQATAGFSPEDNQKALTHLLEAATSEDGLFFINGAGQPTFDNRYAPFIEPHHTPKAVFADRRETDPAGILVTELIPSYDLDQVVNDWTVTIAGGTPQRVVDRAAQNPDPGIDAYTKLLLHGDGADAATSFPDSATAKTVTAVGNAQVDTAQSKFGGASILFDGAGDFLTLDDHADWAFGAGDFTLDFWVRFNAVDALQVFLRQLDAVASAGHVGFQTYWDPSNNLIFHYSIDGITVPGFAFPWTPSTATWYHVAIVRNGTNVLAFVNGTQIGTTQTLSGTLFDAAEPLTIGAVIDGGDSVNGWMDEVRISKGIARWTANFTPHAGAYALPVVAPPTSQDQYGQRSASVSSLVTSDDEALATAQWKLPKYKQPINRIEQITTMPGDDLDAWVTLLGLEIGDRITIKEKPPGFSAVVTADYIIQRLEVTVPVSLNATTFTYQLWPASSDTWFRLGDATLGKLDSGNKFAF